MGEVEGMSLGEVEFLVFDEADRLFEMGFAEQLHQIMKVLPEHRQTMLVSATMPQILAEFARAGLHNPEVVRLDTEMKISPDLQTLFFNVRAEEKTAALVYLLKEVIPRDQQTIVFACTKHHVEFLGVVLREEGIVCTTVYGSMDQTARTIAVSKFRNRKASVLIVTDVAARGVDIPLLDNVVNYNFPAGAKLFVHRVGRAARAGRKGIAYSLVLREEVGHLVDLTLFLGQRLVPSKATRGALAEGGEDVLEPMGKDELEYGAFPQSLLDDICEHVKTICHDNSELTVLTKVCSNAYKQYMRSITNCSTESARRAHAMASPGIHSMFQSSLKAGSHNSIPEAIQGYCVWAEQLKNFRPAQTVLEAEGGGEGVKLVAKSTGLLAMQAKRREHDRTILSNIHRVENVRKVHDLAEEQNAPEETESLDTEEIAEQPSGKASHSLMTTGRFRDDAFFVSAAPSTTSQAGVEMSVHGKSRLNALDEAILDLEPEDAEAARKLRQVYHWDKKKKAYVKMRAEDVEKAELGKKRGGSKFAEDMFKKKKKDGPSMYQKWSAKTNKSIGDGDDDGGSHAAQQRGGKGKGKGKGGGRGGVVNKGVKSELKTADQGLEGKERAVAKEVAGKEAAAKEVAAKEAVAKEAVRREKPREVVGVVVAAENGRSVKTRHFLACAHTIGSQQVW
ncbi:hypothetical protein CYMTET_47621 [Cymbomonas tetramitiformis]|uniref:RNA helicase n=1 Tax=Cymbomonas tetramitiformis TaxID=36881 RepID=A0AAE0BV79_9CHLO|nr:hypothetical protein CYMTET_47621 [Cymbomonas tetramitiformis]